VVPINGKAVAVSFREELESFDWTRPRWMQNKLLATSPFRFDRTPSFFVNLETGSWKDSGAVDREWSSGGFIKLLAFLRNETYQETKEYLLWKYDEEWDGDTEKLTLSLSLPRVERNWQPLDMSVLDPYKFRHPYLERRGISETVQRMFKIGYDKRSKAVTIPWFDNRGLANIKYRRTESKIFWYYKGGKPLRDLIFGINHIYARRDSQAVLVEGEVDALYLWTVGIPAIAIGGSAFTEEKADLIKRSPIERLMIATDNDAVGRRIREEVKTKLAGYLRIEDVVLPEQYKDINEITDVEVVKTVIANRCNLLPIEITF
jgi:DNA primase